MQVLTTLPLLLASLLSSSSAAAPPPSGYRFTLTHVDSKGGFTRAELLRRAAHRSRHRAATMLPGYSYSRMSSSSDTRPTRLRSGQAEYLMELAIGTPPVPFVALADTGSDLTWTQCQPCKLCFAQDTPVYDPAASSSFSPATCASASCLPVWSQNCSAAAPCRYRYVYDDGAYSAGVMGAETLTFGSGSGGVSVGGIAFGCGVDNGGLSYNSTGTVGLGRGSLSLVAQLGVGKFSYCLTDFFETSLGSPVLFGSLAELAPGAAAAAHSTPLVQSPWIPSRYFVSLEGISLGGARLPIPNGTFDLRADGSGGMIVDSGTIFTVLVESAFRVVVDSVAGVLGQPVANASSLDSPCFPAPPGERRLPEMPDMVLHFAGGADMRLRRDNYMSFNQEEAAAFCLNVVGTTSSVSVLGNFQQQNIQMLYDITVGQLSFVPTDCSKL
ncbi:hypothetical protein GQ55_8G207200 [Panicum hallii var. hallii]|uniref:Peptidase A1 domain-containing protein n=1 Tax=Panicum hallii var. hallii TaxID=1504633 RepID=A0A2T7CPH9_9POAL|nr:hypothetical protein GQ55_8G207200 [Panicum hallii var. hallii]